MQDWEAYLAYLRAAAHRRALQEAALAADSDAARGPRLQDGAGEVQIVYQVSEAPPPWDEAALGPYLALKEGGEWIQSSEEST
jgi:hypothetical protein